MDQFDEYIQEYLTKSKNALFYRVFGRNRPIETIDGYDETVHRGPFQKYRGHWISIDGLDAALDLRYKTPLNRAPWIAIGRSRCAPRHLIKTVIILLIKHMLLIVIDVPRLCFILIQCSTIGHVTWIFKNRVELSPTREKLKEFEGFIRRGDLEG